MVLTTADRSRAGLVAWVGEVVGQPYAALSDVPAKAAALMLHTMFGGGSCPLSAIEFRDGTSANGAGGGGAAPTEAQVRNCIEVLRLAAAQGFTGSLDGRRWAAAEDTAGEMRFWLWLRGVAEERPLPPGSCALGDVRAGPAAAGSKRARSDAAAALPPPPAVAAYLSAKAQLDNLLGGDAHGPAAAGHAGAAPVPPDPVVCLLLDAERRELQRLEVVRQALIQACHRKDRAGVIDAYVAFRGGLPPPGTR